MQWHDRPGVDRGFEKRASISKLTPPGVFWRQSDTTPTYREFSNSPDHCDSRVCAACKLLDWEVVSPVQWPTVSFRPSMWGTHIWGSSSATSFYYASPGDLCTVKHNNSTVLRAKQLFLEEQFSCSVLLWYDRVHKKRIAYEWCTHIFKTWHLPQIFLDVPGGAVRPHGRRL